MTRDEIRELRHKAGLTQVAMAKILSVSTSTVISWEGGKRHPHKHTVKLIRMLIKPR